MRACSPSFASYLVLPSRLSRKPPSAAVDCVIRSSTGRCGIAFAAMSASSSEPRPPLPFDGSARRGGLLHPRFGDPSPAPPGGEAPPPVRAAQQRCSKCGGELSVEWLEGRWRHACVGGARASFSVSAPSAPALPPPSSDGGVGCGTIAYANPLLVVGAIITDVDDALSAGGSGGSGGGSGRRGGGLGRAPRVLLCKRAIEPRKGSWTLPAGYLELGESAAEGAARETWEEARARVEIFGPYFHAVRIFSFFLAFFSELEVDLFFRVRKRCTSARSPWQCRSLRAPARRARGRVAKKTPVFFHPFFSPDRSLRNRTSPRSGRPTSSSAASS